MSRHTLPKLDLLEYALEGAVTRRGTQSGNLTDAEEDLLDKDIAEIKRRVKMVKLAETRRAKP